MEDKNDVNSTQRGKDRQTARSANFRREAGEKFLANRLKFLDEELFANIGGPEEYVKRTNFTPQPRSVVLPISTRSIGVLVNESVLAINATVPSVDAPVPELFRTALHQVEIAVAEANKTQPDPTFAESIPKMRASVESETIARAHPKHLTTVVHAVHQIANATVNDINMYPRLHDDPKFGQSLSRLRDHVDRMSSLTTPLPERLEGHALNTIPSAVWGGDFVEVDGVQVFDEGSIRILNPNTVLPPRYGFDELCQDYAIIERYFERIGRKVQKYVSRVDHTNRGNGSFLVSTSANNVRLNSMRDGDRLVLQPFEGDATDWYSNCILQRKSFLLGAFSMFGECNGNTRSMIVRSPEMASQVINQSWRQLLSAIL